MSGESSPEPRSSSFWISWFCPFVLAKVGCLLLSER